MSTFILNMFGEHLEEHNLSISGPVQISKTPAALLGQGEYCFLHMGLGTSIVRVRLLSVNELNWRGKLTSLWPPSFTLVLGVHRMFRASVNSQHPTLILNLLDLARP